jgi:hypothetical protein
MMALPYRDDGCSDRWKGYELAIVHFLDSNNSGVKSQELDREMIQIHPVTQFPTFDT